jgi:hypothetical protein
VLVKIHLWWGRRKLQHHVQRRKYLVPSSTPPLGLLVMPSCSMCLGRNVCRQLPHMFAPPAHAYIELISTNVKTMKQVRLEIQVFCYTRSLFLDYPESGGSIPHKKTETTSRHSATLYLYTLSQCPLFLLKGPAAYAKDAPQP